jgi:hypothetical protein
MEAARANAAPVALLNGDGVVDIMLEHEIGVTSGTLEIYEISVSATDHWTEQTRPAPSLRPP